MADCNLWKSTGVYRHDDDGRTALKMMMMNILDKKFPQSGSLLNLCAHADWEFSSSHLQDQGELAIYELCITLLENYLP